MARHRAPRRAAAVIVGGLVAVVAGLALLLTPAAPIAARAGSVLGGPPAGPAAVAPPAPVEGADGSTAGRASSSTPGVTAPVVTGPVVTAPAAPQEPRRLPLPALQGFVPDRLVVEALDVDAVLVTTLVDAAGAFVPPEHPDELAWWRGVRPGGGTGSVVVAGHIDSTRFGQGPLARLVDLVPGDRAVVSGPDGERVEYAVRGIETFPKDSLPASELFTADGAERLVLVTCGGTYDRREGSWDSNIVAVLDRVPPG